MVPRTELAVFWCCAPVIPGPPGRDYREGKPEYFRSLIETWVSKLILRYLDLVIWTWFSTPLPPTVGGGLNPPGGDHRRPPTLWRSGQLVIEFLFGRLFAFLGVRGSVYDVQNLRK